MAIFISDQARAIREACERQWNAPGVSHPFDKCRWLEQLDTNRSRYNLFQIKRVTRFKYGQVEYEKRHARIRALIARGNEILTMRGHFKNSS